MSELYGETSGKLVVFVRYKPHKYKVPSGRSFVKTNDRQQLLLSVLKSITKNHEQLRSKYLQHVFYICYSEDNDIIAKNIPKQMIYRKEDLVYQSQYED
jgi:hypothetical protein